jgi:hypothetical protein
VSDALATMLEKSKETNQNRGVILHLIEGGLTHLQYADDTIIFLSLDEQTILNAKFLLYCFEDMSGLKINYQKSEVLVMGGQKKIITELQASSIVSGGSSFEISGRYGTQQTYDNNGVVLCSTKSREENSDLAKHRLIIWR